MLYPNISWFTMERRVSREVRKTLVSSDYLTMFVKHNYFTSEYVLGMIQNQHTN